MTAPITTEEFRRQWAKTISEDAFQAQVIEMARTFGWKVAHFRAVRIQRKDGSVYYALPVQADGEGFFDLVMCNGRRTLFVELKKASGRKRVAQEAWMALLLDAGQEALLWRPADMDAIEAVLGNSWSPIEVQSEVQKGETGP